jgi:hypothetical protein
VREYCMADVNTTTQLAKEQLAELEMSWPSKESLV